jgi:hypothetical protein
MTSPKRSFAMSAVVLAAFALAGTTGLCAEETSSVDYQKVADGARWGFLDAADNPLFCMRRAGTDYDVWLIRETKDRHALTIKIVKNDQPVYEWKGHEHSVYHNTPAVEMLISSEAEVNAKTNKGATPLDMAIQGAWAIADDVKPYRSKHHRTAVLWLIDTDESEYSVGYFPASSP